MKKYIVFITAVFVFTLIFAAESYAQNSNNEKNRSLKIVKMQQPTAPGCNSFSEIVEVRVTFGKTRKITDTEITKKSECETFNESILRVVRVIEFEPEIKDGKPVTVTKTLKFNRRMY